MLLFNDFYIMSSLKLKYFNTSNVTIQQLANLVDPQVMAFQYI